MSTAQLVKSKLWPPCYFIFKGCSIDPEDSKLSAQIINLMTLCRQNIILYIGRHS
jgi:hypothetical protein